jgi:DNA repair exonuclease SbcCD nuclease subunit
MRFQFASDLHLEFRANQEWLRNNPMNPVGDVLILAGDIMPLNQLDQLSSFLDECSEKWREVYWLPGNHEYYGSDLALTGTNLIHPIHKNLFLVNNATIKSGDTQFVFSTLWSKISQLNASQISRSVNDFFKIKNNGSLLTVTDFNSLHEQAIAFLEAVQFDRGLQRIVVTHHVPTLINYPAQYLTSPINQAFATELGPLIEAIGADYWIFGHHHQNLPEFRIGKTTLLTNQLGYIHLNEHRSFMPDRSIELKRMKLNT